MLDWPSSLLFAALDEVGVFPPRKLEPNTLSTLGLGRSPSAAREGVVVNVRDPLGSIRSRDRHDVQMKFETALAGLAVAMLPMGLKGRERWSWTVTKRFDSGMPRLLSAKSLQPQRQPMDG